MQLAFIFFNATTNRSFVAARGPHVVGDERMLVHCVVVNAKYRPPPGRAEEEPLNLGWS